MSERLELALADQYPVVPQPRAGRPRPAMTAILVSISENDPPLPGAGSPPRRRTFTLSRHWRSVLGA